MRILVALGGNALLKRGEALSPQNQAANLGIAAEGIAALLAAGHEIVISHGNGPQVGLLALQQAATPDTPFPLDVLGAETQGMIGYMLEQALDNVLDSSRLLATLLTQTRVDRRDPAFRKPSKPIGPVYAEDEARHLAAARGWTVGPDGKGWRRLVASPQPVDILETRVIELLLKAGVTVICTGGGGIPVVETPAGTLVGVEAVVDKDLASALLARQLNADMLMMLTNVDAVYENWGTDAAKPFGAVTAKDLAAHRFAAGSMQPKVDAAIGFVNETGGIAAIGTLSDALKISEARAGTRIAVAL